jgi:Mrp family chromosome partitioning ATPase
MSVLPNAENMAADKPTGVASRERSDSRRTPAARTVREGQITPLRTTQTGDSWVDSSFLQLYYAIEARRTGDMPLVVQFISTAGGAGVTTIASGYARIVASSAPDRVLYVDCGMRRSGYRKGGETRPTLIEAFLQRAPLKTAIISDTNDTNLSWTNLGLADHPWHLGGADRLQALLDELRSNHAAVILDSPPVVVPEAAALSRFSDGTVLVVEAGRTRQSDVDRAKAIVERVGGQIVGLVLNREKQTFPRWWSGRSY